MPRVNNAAIPPRSSLGYLAMLWSNGQWAYGSGALIDAQHVLTCSHNLTDQAQQQQPGQAAMVLFYQGYNQQDAQNPPQGGLQARAAFYSTNYRNGQDAWDVGLCRLAAPVFPAPPCYFEPTVTGVGIVEQNVWLTGYPGPYQGQMWEDVDQVAGVHIDSNSLLYTHDTWPGNSGSPTWQYDAINDVVMQCGIHVSRGPQELRRGVLITQPILQWIQAAQQAANPQGQGFQLVGQ